MSRLDDLLAPYEADIAKAVQELAILTPLRESDLRSFSTNELAEIRALIEAVDTASDENERQAAVMDRISGATKFISKLLGR